ncbi:TPA: N-acetylmuramoyl-L-alanine amidase [Listeria innocua]
MATVNGVSFRQNLVSSSKYGIKAPNYMKAKKITVHNTYNDASSQNETDYCKNNNNEVSFHVAVDDKEAIQVVPFDRNAWHCGDGGNGYGNRNTIGVEACYSKSGGAKYKAAEKNTIKYVAGLCVQQGIIATKDTIKKHQDWSGKYCPHRILDDKRWPAVQQAIIDEYNRITSKSTATNKKTGKQGVYARDFLNIRTKATWDSPVAFKVPIYYYAQILWDTKNGDWVQIEFQGKKGWYKTSFKEYWYEKDPCTSYICVADVNFRKSSKWDSPVAQKKKKGETVRMVKKAKNGWLEFGLTNGVIGYIPNSTKYVKKK